jgi:hypothetical protein
VRRTAIGAPAGRGPGQLSRRQLNRATLARQMLLARERVTDARSFEVRVGK